MEQSNSNLITKINKPKLSKVLQREALFSRLKSSNKNRLTWITGPAGSGKTVLVASYLDAYPCPYLWYKLDITDADTPSIFYHLKQATSKTIGYDTDQLELFTPEYYKNLELFSRRFFRNMISVLPENCLLIFDNFHEIEHDQRILEVFGFLLDEISENVSVVIISRTTLPVTLTKYRLNNDFSLIGWNDLRFTENECLKTYRIHTGQDNINVETADLAYRKTEGWIAGYLLLLKSDNPGFSLSQDDLPVSQKNVFNYFANEVFNKANEETKNILLMSSFLVQFNKEMVTKLSESSTAGIILDELVENQYFIHLVTNNPPTFAYHDLFQEFLFDRAITFYSSGELDCIKSKAIDILVSYQMYELALDMAISMSHWSIAIKILLENAMTFVSQGRFETLYKWIFKIPDEYRKNNAWILYWEAFCLQIENASASRDYFDKAYRLFEKQGDLEGLFTTWASAVDTFIYLWDDFQEVDPWIDRFFEKQKLISSLDNNILKAKVAGSVFGALMFRQPNHPDIAKWEKVVTDLVVNGKNTAVTIMLANNLVLYHLWWKGHIDKCGLFLNTLQKRARSQFGSPLAAVLWHVMDTSYSAHIIDFDRGMESFQAGMNIIEETGIKKIEFLLRSQAFYVNIAQNELENAKKHLDINRNIYNESAHTESAHFHYLAVWYALCANDMQMAKDNVYAMHQRGVQSHAPTIEVFGTITLIQYIAETGEYQDALEKLAELELKTKSFKNRYLEIGIRLLRCWINWFGLEHQTESVLEDLSIALEIAKVNQIVCIPWIGWRRPIISSLYCLALEQQIESEYVKNIIERRGILPNARMFRSDNWPWKIRIHTFNHLEIIVDNKKIEFSGKAQRKPIELLIGIICQGGIKVNHQVLLDDLWEDADGDAAYRSLITTLQRLRKLLGYKKSILLADGKLSLNREYCWLDVWAFEQKLDSSKNSKEIANAASFYSNEFLKNENTPWVKMERTKLKNKFVKAIKKVTKDLELANQYDKAITNYEKGLEVIPYVEELYQGVINCYIKLDDPIKAKLAYEACEAMLNYHLSAQPSTKTQNLLIKNL